jgi:hypothetical protein
MSPDGPAGNQNTVGVWMKGKIESASDFKFLPLTQNSEKIEKMNCR